MYKKTCYIVVSVIFGLVLGSALIGLSEVDPEHTEYLELWEGEPDVKNCPIEPLWFLSEETGVEHQGCLEATERLKSLIESCKHEALNSVILPPIPDVRNNVVYLLISPGTVEEIREVLEAPADVEICFIEAPAPRETLLEWAEYVFGSVEVLRYRKGVEIWSVGITPNGTIYVGMEEVTARNVNALLSYLKGFVPPGILVIHQEGPYES